MDLATSFIWIYGNNKAGGVTLDSFRGLKQGSSKAKAIENIHLEAQSSQSNNRKMCTSKRKLQAFSIGFFLKAFTDFFLKPQVSCINILCKQIDHKNLSLFCILPFQLLFFIIHCYDLIFYNTDIILHHVISVCLLCYNNNCKIIGKFVMQSKQREKNINKK